MESKMASGEHDVEKRESIDIPIRDEHGHESDEAIQIFLDELPLSEELLGVLKAEKANLKLWHQFAVEYYRQGKLEEFKNILQEGCSPEVERFYAEDRSGRIALLNAYAAYKIDLGKPKPGENKQRKREKGKFLTEALDCLNRADRISNADDRTWVNKAVLQMVRGDYRQAERDFSMALELNPNNLIALFGMGSIYFHSKKFRDALEQYKLAIKLHPGCSASARVNLGLCFYELGKHGRARECFLRALELNPNEVEGLVALAVMELGKASMYDDEYEEEDEESKTGIHVEGKRTLLQRYFHEFLYTRNYYVRRALQRLELAYSLDPNNPMVLNHLANHFFIKDRDNEFDRMKNLASNAFKNTELETIKAESSYILGRLFHHRGEFEKAREFYSHALKFWPNFVLAEYAVAQMEIYKQETANHKQKPKKEEIITALNKVEKYLRKVIQECSSDRDTLFLLGYIKQKLGKREEARELWKRVTDLHPGDREAWIEQALSLHKISEKDNPCRTLTKSEKGQALRAYNKAISTYISLGQEVPNELYCNIGVLKYSLANYAAACADFEKALSMEEENSAVTASNVTLFYNLARAKEMLGDFNEAENLYKRISTALPEYVDAEMRLGCISQDRGQLAEAEEFFQTAGRNDPKNYKPLLLQGILKLEKGEKKPAKEKFIRIVNKINPHQAYARLCLGNADLEEAQITKDKERRGKCIQNANGVYEGVLMRRNYNIYAANGIAALIALRDEYRMQARQIFERIKEVSDTFDIPEVWMNLGHLSILEKQYDVAASLYEQSLKRFFFGSNSELENFVAHAHLLGKKPEQAKIPLLKALHKNPEDLSLWFNLAVTRYASAIQYLGKPSENRNLLGVNQAIDSIEQASDLFQWLSQAKGLASQNAEKTFLQAPSTPEGPPPNEEVDEWILGIAKASSTRFSEANSVSSDVNVNGMIKSQRTLAERAAKISTFTKAGKSRQSYDSCQKSLLKAREVANYHREKEIRQQRKLEQANKRSQDAEAERRQNLIRIQELERKKQLEIEKRATEQQERSRQVAQKLFEDIEKNKRIAEQRKTKKKLDKEKQPNARTEQKFIDESSGDESSASSSSSSSSSSDSDAEPAKANTLHSKSETETAGVEDKTEISSKVKKRKLLKMKNAESPSAESSDESDLKKSKVENKKLPEEVVVRQSSKQLHTDNGATNDEKTTLVGRVVYSSEEDE